MKKQIVCYTVATNAMEMEQKRTENIRKQFLDMLDNASNNLYNGNRGKILKMLIMIRHPKKNTQEM